MEPAPAKRLTQDDYEIIYHPDRGEFELITPQDCLWLSASLIREMAELLPPLRPDVPPETVH